MLDYDDDYFLEEDKLESQQVCDQIESQSESNAQSSAEATHTQENNEFDEKNDSELSECLLFEMAPCERVVLRENTMGMTVTSGTVTIKKDANNLIGISIGGGAPLCPCLYIVQIFDNTAACKDGTLQAGDELVAVNGQAVKSKTKVEVAKMIQAAKDEVVINYNKLHADPQQGKSLDIVLKKVKHRLVENMSSSTADALGLSRAILCNDTLVKKLQELQDTEVMYRGLVEHYERVLKAHFDVSQAIKQMGEVFAELAVREPQARASEAFRLFAEQHRNMERMEYDMLKAGKPVLGDMGTYLYKAIPDTRLTVKKYADAKFEYLAYCLKVKEMDDEECSYAAIQESLYRVETGNYEYRLILRCRQVARERFARLRSDVLVKMELLDNKHVQSLGGHLNKLIQGFADLNGNLLTLLNGPALFPVEVDLSNNAFQYKSTTKFTEDQDDDDDEIENGIELKEEKLGDNNILGEFDAPSNESGNELSEFQLNSDSDALLPGFESSQQVEPDYNSMDNLTLLSTLNLHDTSPQSSSSYTDSNSLLPDLIN